MSGGYCPKTGKVAYASRAEATATMNGMKRKKIRRRKTDRLNVFRCEACGCWHVGNRDK